MLTAKFSTKRVLGVVLVAGLAVTGTIAVAGNSEAATIASVKLSPATGTSLGGTVVSLAGKGFTTAAGSTKVGKVWFESGACAVVDITVANTAVSTAISPTKITVTTPVLALAPTPKPTGYNVCIANIANTTVVGAGKFTSYLAPTINDQTVAATVGVSPVTGAAGGGGTLTIGGENFTTKTTATVGGLPLTNVKVEVGPLTAVNVADGDDTLTGTVPAGTSATASIVVTSEGGKSPAAGVTFAYLATAKVSPSSGNGTALNGITVTGSGFSSLIVDTASVLANSKTSVLLVPAKQTLTGTLTNVAALSGYSCASVQVESDTSLSCTLPLIAPATASGGYTVVVLTVDGAKAVVPATSTGYTAGASYTVAAF
jgi:hypothetical protein